MIALAPLQKQVGLLVEDLRMQVAADEGLSSQLRKEYADARAARRTAATYESWLEDVLDQAAVAWVLGCVFVRFCEDNALMREVWIGGPEEHASVEVALQSRQAYLIAAPTHNDRHWLREAFAHLRGAGATAKIFDEHNPVWRFAISGRAAEVLSDFFRRGAGWLSLRSADLETRFLGDLYQDLSAHARETYALLQTPEFVEEFILDRTFEPAYREFGLANMSVIDPTCGSGHFLLGAFDRLFTRWKEREPATPANVLVDRALRQVTGVDINPAAVAIARFRLMIAGLKASGHRDLATEFPVRVAAGDSLLEWRERSRHQGDLLAPFENRPEYPFWTEDAKQLGDYLNPGQYTVVVGNPPYITVKDRARNEVYRELYSDVCHRQYQLTVPFAKRFFDLAKRADGNGDGAGYVGQITSNGFMKREFGVKLINEYFALQVELTEVIDTSGAYIPGHGTPTVILIGRANKRRRSESIRAVLGVRGEPGQPADPANGLVWAAIVDQIDRPDSESEWISAADLDRSRLASHPWSLSGGGASGVMEILESERNSVLREWNVDIGSGAVTREDNAYMLGAGLLRRRAVPAGQRLPMIEGEVVRDWSIIEPLIGLWPYDADSLEPVAGSSLIELLWPARRILSERVAYGATQLQRGLKWFEYSMFFAGRFRAPLSISFAFVATHNNFVLDRGGKVFSRSAPVIKLPAGATEDEHLRLLGVLNSSTACFWLKQVCQAKTGADNTSGGGNRWSPEPWYSFYEFTGTKLQNFPLPDSFPDVLSREIDLLGQRLMAASPTAVTTSDVPTRRGLDVAEREWQSIRLQMIALQEELDWDVYRRYGLLETALTANEPPDLEFGERAFEIMLARRMQAGVSKTRWFDHHGYSPVTELPAHWSPEYRALVEKRIAVIESDRNIALIERPEYKRRWATEGWDAMRHEALRNWLLDRLEASELWGGAPTPLSIGQLADRVRHDDDFRSVLDLYMQTDQHDLVKSLSKLVADEYVPYLPSQRYKPAGLRKRAEWERTWALQRREDAGEKADIPVPAKYTSADFLKASFWRNRGKLDVPKERFISYPKAGRDGDGTELIGWAGWDHLAQAQALATIYLDRKTQGGWKADRLLPLLAGIAELEPWLHQWHGEPRPGFPGTPAQFFTGLIDTELAALDADRADLATIRGVEVPA
ncbi:type I restriction-modification system DNA methylase subunit [Asanoa ferruginea]|uniref:site-specific DNA-methyltransferase (adenine-specific) n=1 Tax=Asanoa ferruginea TaxID=53367 RepID=A0A3D9ZFW5_9ACTN|nr:BREX-2 system adenine-specific DNA-methyltransferase PglX [Asanoa ferruginea]REF96181.1 type I restriction-modification system DNA methylase subunit [Asanoa ferruginea]GIF49325.1 DNA methylase [Asanoa ferruginea]